MIDPEATRRLLKQLRITIVELAERMGFKNPENPNYLYKILSTKKGSERPEPSKSYLLKVAQALKSPPSAILDKEIKEWVYEELREKLENAGSPEDVLSMILGISADQVREEVSKYLPGSSRYPLVGEVGETYYNVPDFIGKKLPSGFSKYIDFNEIADPMAYCIKVNDKAMLPTIPLNSVLLISPSKKFCSGKVGLIRLIHPDSSKIKEVLIRKIHVKNNSYVLQAADSTIEPRVVPSVEVLDIHPIVMIFEQD